MDKLKQNEVQLEISDWVKSTIVQCIRDALEDRVTQFKEQTKLSTYTCLPFLKGDFICTCLDERFIHSDILSVPLKRYGWEGRIIVDQSSKVVCSIISKSRLAELRKHAFSKSIPHYSVLFSAMLNGDLVGKNKQLSWFEGYPYSDDLIANGYNKHLGGIVNPDAGYRYCIFTYEIRNQELFNCELVVLDKNLDYVSSISLNEFIGLDFAKLSSIFDSQPSKNIQSNLNNESHKSPNSRVKLKIKKQTKQN